MNAVTPWLSELHMRERKHLDLTSAVTKLKQELVPLESEARRVAALVDRRLHLAAQCEKLFEEACATWPSEELMRLSGKATVTATVTATVIQFVGRREFLRKSREVGVAEVVSKDPVLSQLRDLDQLRESLTKLLRLGLVPVEVLIISMSRTINDVGQISLTKCMLHLPMIMIES